MNPNTLTHHGVTPESLVLPTEYEFMSIENMDKLRDQQLTEQHVSIEPVKDIGDVIRAQNKIMHAREARNNGAEEYVASHLDRAKDPELFDKLVGLVNQSSIHTADSELWNNGERDVDGNLVGLETSGKDKHAAALVELLGLTNAPAPNTPPAPAPAPTPPPAPAPNLPPVPTPPNPAVPTPPTPNHNTTPDLNSPEARAAKQALSASRDKLAKLSIQRRRMIRKNSKKAKALETEYDAAQDAYQAARITYGALKASASAHTLEQRGLTGNELQTNLQASVVREILDEHQSFTEAEAKQLSDDPRRRAKLARFFAHNKALFYGTNGIVGAALGFGLNKASKGVVAKGVALTSAVALPAAVAGFAAAKTTKAILQSSVGNNIRLNRDHTKRADQDHKRIVETADDHITASDDHEAMVTAGNEFLSDQITERTHKDIRSNRNRVIASAAIGGAMGGLGFLAAEHFSGGSHDKPGGGGSGGESSGSNGDSSNGGSSEHHRGEVRGYKTRVTIEKGEGYTQALQDLAEQKDIHLTGSQSFKLYEHLNDKFNGDFLTNDSSYRMADGNWGIDHPATTRWNPAIVREMHRWIEQHENHLDKD